VELLRMGGEDQVLPALAVRYRLESPWLTALEIGGALPTDVSSGFHQNSFTNEYTTPVTMDHAQIDSISEAHVAGVWEFWRMPLFIPELSLGVSVGRFGNQATTTTAFVTQVDNTQTTVSQIIQLGGTVPITQTVAFHADLGYVRYYNHIQPTDEHTLDLFVSAVTFRALIAVRL